MQIIDFDRRGNLVRFYLGDASADYGGDDWDDRPYDCNAGKVYEQYIKGYRDVVFPFDDMVLEPCDGEYNCSVSKDDMKKRHVPCIIAVPKKIVDDDDYLGISFARWAAADGIKKYYFGDEMEPDPASLEPGETKE